jgi:hypothetical protein
MRTGNNAFLLPAKPDEIWPEGSLRIRTLPIESIRLDNGRLVHEESRVRV